MSGFVGGRAGAREAPWALDAPVLARVLGTDAERGLPARAAFTGFLVLRTLFDAVLGRTARQAFHDVARLGAAEVWSSAAGGGRRHR